MLAVGHGDIAMKPGMIARMLLERLAGMALRRSQRLGEGRIGRINWRQASGGVRVHAQGAIELVDLTAGRLFSRPCARVSIVWGDPVGEGDTGGGALGPAVES